MKKIFVFILILSCVHSFGQLTTRKYFEQLNQNRTIDSGYVKQPGDSVFNYSGNAFICRTKEYYSQFSNPIIPNNFSNFHLDADGVYRNFTPRAQAIDPSGITNSTPAGQALLSIQTPASPSLARINSDGTVGTRTVSQAKSDLSIDSIITAIGGKQATLGFVPYNSTNPSGFISSVPAQTFTSLTAKPTTLSGYGITDASLSSHTHTFASLTSKPTTVSGYGITDASTLSGSENITNKTIGGFNTALDAQATDSYVVTISPTPAAYTTGMIVIFRANTANTTGCTINVNGLGVKNIVKRVNTTMATGDILALMFCWLVYDGTNFIMLNPIVN